MKILQSSAFRAIRAIIIGALLILYPDNTVTGITIAIGVLFLVSGIISVLTYVQARRHANDYKVYDAEGRLINGQQPTFPLVGIGSVIFGLVLAVFGQGCKLFLQGFHLFPVLLTGKTVPLGQVVKLFLGGLHLLVMQFLRLLA